jgi:hypothetical protein
MDEIKLLIQIDSNQTKYCNIINDKDIGDLPDEYFIRYIKKHTYGYALSDDKIALFGKHMQYANNVTDIESYRKIFYHNCSLIDCIHRIAEIVDLDYHLITDPIYDLIYEKLCDTNEVNDIFDNGMSIAFDRVSNYNEFMSMHIENRRFKKKSWFRVQNMPDSPFNELYMTGVISTK